MTNEELLDELRGEIAKLREEIAELRAGGMRIVIVQPSVPMTIPAYPPHPAVPWYPQPWSPQPTYPIITW